MERIVTAIIVFAIISSGCAQIDQKDDEKTESPEHRFQQLKESVQKSGYKLNYSLKGSEASDVPSIQISSTEESKKFSAQFKTPGGDYVVKTYQLGNRTFQCTEDSGTCKIGIQEEIHRPLMLERWDLSNISIHDKKTVGGDSCRSFSAEPENLQEQGFVTSEESKISLCLGEDRLSQIVVSREDNILVNYTLQEYGEYNGQIELPEPLEIVGHCTDSYEVDITPFKEVDDAKLKINNYSKSITLPEKSQTEIYSIPEESIRKGVNNLTVTTDQSSQNIECFRRN